MAHVLVVEQDALLSRLLVQVLRSAGHAAQGLAPGQPLETGDVALAVVSTPHPVVLQRLRAAGVPVLLVSASRASAAGTPVLVRPPARALLAAVGAALASGSADASAPAAAGSGPARLPLAG